MQPCSRAARPTAEHRSRLPLQAELLVIDEAAAIPLPLVKAMLGPYLVFLCSTGGQPVGVWVWEPFVSWVVKGPAAPASASPSKRFLHCASGTLVLGWALALRHTPVPRAPHFIPHPNPTTTPCTPAVNGYEGTGRSLSLKLIQQLRQQGAKLASGEGKAGADAGGAGGMRTFREVILGEPIR